MSKTIFSSEVAAGLQDLDNRYATCRGLFDRARKLNSQAMQQGLPIHNASAIALAEYAEYRKAIGKEEK